MNFLSFGLIDAFKILLEVKGGTDGISVWPTKVSFGKGEIVENFKISAKQPGNYEIKFSLSGPGKMFIDQPPPAQVIVCASFSQIYDNKFSKFPKICLP